jgi:hypothetical protein
MLWSQYKLATKRVTEFLRKQITGIPNITNQNSDFLTLQTSEFQKKNPTRIFGIENGIRIPLTMGVPETVQKSEFPTKTIGAANHVSDWSEPDFEEDPIVVPDSTVVRDDQAFWP